MEKSEFYREARSDLTGPLDGVRVLEATTTWAGPMCGCVLADLGADVIKVELPSGEVARNLPPFIPDGEAPLSFAHATVNRNKRSLTLDLHGEKGREIFLDLARRSDILVENFRPGTLDDWGLGYAGVRAVKPDIIYVSVTGFGQFGPDHDRVGYDPLAQARSGFASLNGEPEGPPVKAATFLADDLGGLHGALSALAALAHRQRTGEGQHIDVALLDSLLFQSNGFLTLGALGIPLERTGNEFAFAAPANVYACSDGHVFAGVLLDSHWKILCRLLGRAELAEDPAYGSVPARIGRRSELNELMSKWCEERTVADVVQQFAMAGIPAARVCSYADAAGDPHVRERDMLQPATQPGGAEIPITGPAAKFSRTPTRVRSAAPALGAHTDAVLTELGFSAEDLQRLRSDGVV
ncbi:MAG: CoA transferase [Deltaproteobacteria bacterium]|nr:CoA transferase [Deltaproteobacteria bacterium]MBW2416473.1 CoA transferase [Deltaproteobacteria bacterium]